MKDTTDTSAPSISSLISTIWEKPPGTQPNKPVARLTPARRCVRKPNSRLMPRMIEVTSSITGSWATTWRAASAVKDLPIT